MATKKLVCHCNQALKAATTSAMNKNSAEILVNSKVDLNRNNLDHSFVIPKYSIKDEMEKVDRLDLTGEVCQKYQLYEETFNEKTRKRQINFIMPEPPKTPVLDPRDTHLAENRSEEVKSWVNRIVTLREEMEQKRWIFVPGSDMAKILKHVFGADNQALLDLENACDNMTNDPFLRFRKNHGMRLEMDLDKETARRLTRQPWILRESDEFKREDAGHHRYFGEVQDWVAQNSAFQALKAFESFMISGLRDVVEPREGFDKNKPFINLPFFTRIINTQNILGSPTSEGTHQDGVEFVMTTILKSSNVDFEGGAARTALVKLEEPTGVPFDKVDSSNVVKSAQLRHFLDSLLWLDTSFKHVVSDLSGIEPGRPLHRDMILSMTRRMAKEDGGSPLAPFDTDVGHKELPCVFSLRSKHLTQHYSRK